MAIASDNKFPKVILEERLSNGSDTSNPAADHRALFLGEDGQLHLRDSAGTVTDIGTGGGGGGGLVLLESHTASASATLDFTTRNASGQSGATFQSDFDDYLFKLVGIMPATNSVDLRMLMSTNGGSSYDTSGVYSYDHFVWRAGGSGTAGTTGAAQIVLNFNGSGDVVTNSVAGLPVNGRLELYSPLDTTQYKTIFGRLAYRDSSFRVVNDIRGSYESATAVNAVRFLASSGNITSGTIRVYGVAK